MTSSLSTRHQVTRWPARGPARVLVILERPMIAELIKMTLNHGVYRRQDLPPAFIPDGGVLVVSRAALFDEIPGVPLGGGPHAFFGRDRRGIESGGEVIDIDSPRDLVLADTVLRERTPEGTGQR